MQVIEEMTSDLSVSVEVISGSVTTLSFHTVTAWSRWLVIT